MRLHVMSDLHLDHWRGDPFRPSCDDEANTVLVLAGDVIGLTPQCFKAALAFFIDVVARYKQVIYVTGNHEYYGTSWEVAHRERTDLELRVFANTGKDLVVAEDFRAVTVDAQRFICGTMWIPEPARGTPDITDNRLIKRYKPEVFRRHRTFCDYVAMLEPSDIVVTHHLPSNQSVAQEYAGDIYNAWFCAPEMEERIWKDQPKLWIHGHTHYSFDYCIGQTRVLCNPRGYPGETCTTFNPQLIVEI